MHGQHGHNTPPHTRLPTSSLGMDAWITSQLNVHVDDLIRKLRWSLMYLAYVLPIKRDPLFLRVDADWFRGRR